MLQLLFILKKGRRIDWFHGRHKGRQLEEEEEDEEEEGTLVS